MKIEKLKTEIEANVKDPRRQYGNIRHKLEDIITIGLCSTVCGGEDFVGMEEFGKEREEWLRKFLELPNGIPDSDTFRRLFEKIEPDELSLCLYNWLEAAWEERSVIAVDGKTIRGSGNNEHKAYHVVSAFVTENRITFGEITVDEKSNEITAVPELIDMLDVEGAIVTADAMSCQKKIVEKITKKKADYVIALKDNQRNMYEEVKNYFETHKENKFQAKTTFDDKKHARTETRKYCLLTDVSWIKKQCDWSNLNAVGYVKSIVIENGKTTEYTRYFITSITDVNEFSCAVRKHWSIENQLHWCLDVIFREDDSKAKKDNSPRNLNVFRKIAISLIHNVKTSRTSFKKMMFKAALNPDVLANIIFSPIKK